jgi:hypothetical protein
VYEYKILSLKCVIQNMLKYKIQVCILYFNIFCTLNFNTFWITYLKLIILYLYNGFDTFVMQPAQNTSMKVTKGDQNIKRFTTFRMPQIHIYSHVLISFILISVWIFWKIHIDLQIEQHKKPNTSTQINSSKRTHTMPSFSRFRTFTVLWMLYSFFWVFPQHINFMCQHFRTLCLFHLHKSCEQHE